MEGDAYCPIPCTDLTTSHADSQISMGQGSAAYQSSIRFRIDSEEVEHLNTIGAGCEREAERFFKVHPRHCIEAGV